MACATRLPAQEKKHFGKIVTGDGGSLKADLLSVGVRFNF